MDGKFDRIKQTNLTYSINHKMKNFALANTCQKRLFKIKRRHMSTN